MTLANLIRQASLGAIEAVQPVAVMFATVTKVEPLEVNVEQRFTLTSDFLIVPESLTKYEVDISHTHSVPDGNTGGMQPDSASKVVVRKGLEVGDKVILLRIQGGRQFVILDKVV
nr:MAG: hypothetical protein DIU61_14460 [Bacteroidota bacterium]